MISDGARPMAASNGARGAVPGRAASPADQLTRLLLASGVVGPLLFIAAMLIEGATRPGYSVWRNYVSDLALSGWGWEQIANFLVCGLLSVAFAVGLRRAWRAGPAAVWGPRLVGLFGASLAAAGVFVTDPGRGYPPGLLQDGHQTWHGALHGIVGTVVFAAISAACFVVARRFAAEPRDRGWVRYCRMTGCLVPVLFALSLTMGPVAEPGTPALPAGLVQRAAIVVGWSWLALTAWRVLRSARRERVADADGVPLTVPA